MNAISNTGASNVDTAPAYSSSSTGVEKLTIAKAINRALEHELANDPKVLMQGEDIGDLGGVYRITEGLKAKFGGARVVDSPLAESGIIGTSIGLALRGLRPVPEIQFDGFVFPGFDQLVSQLAKMYTRVDGAQTLPVTVRLPYGGGIGSVEHHSESPEVYFAHTAGLRVLTYATAHDAYWVTRQAIRSEDPVILMEPKRRYFTRSEVNFDDAGAAHAPAHVVRTGTDATLIAYGPQTQVALDAAKAAAKEGRSLEVIDLRSLSPIDFDTIVTSVKKTGRAVVIHEASTYAGLGAEIAARIQNKAFLSLEAPVQRVGGWHMPYPPSNVEAEFLPNVDRILDAVDFTFTF